MNIRAIGLSLALGLCGGAAFAQTPEPPVPKTDTVSVIFADRGRTCFFLQFATSPLWFGVPYNDVPAIAVLGIAYLGKASVTYEVDPVLLCGGFPMINTVSSGIAH